MRFWAALFAVLNGLMLLTPIADLFNPGRPFELTVLVPLILMTSANLVLAVQVFRKRIEFVRPVFYVNAALLACNILVYAAEAIDRGLTPPDSNILIFVLYLSAHMFLARRLLSRLKKESASPGRAAGAYNPARPLRPEPARAVEEFTAPRPDHLNEPPPEEAAALHPDQSGPAFSDKAEALLPDRPVDELRPGRGPAPLYKNISPVPAFIRDFVGLRQSLTDLFLNNGYTFKPEAEDIIKYFTLAALVVSHRRWYGPGEHENDPRIIELTGRLTPEESASGYPDRKYQRRYLNPLKIIDNDFEEVEEKLRSGVSSEALEAGKIWFKSWTTLYFAVTDPLPSEVSVKDWSRGIDRGQLIYDGFKSWMNIIRSYWRSKD